MYFNEKIFTVALHSGIKYYTYDKLLLMIIVEFDNFGLISKSGQASKSI